MVADHLSRIPNAPIVRAPSNEDFPYEHILAIFKEPWYADIVYYLVTEQLPTEWTKQDQYRFFPKYGASLPKYVLLMGRIISL